MMDEIQLLVAGHGSPFAKLFGVYPEAEYFFALGRKFAFDFAWPRERVAIEVDGGVFGTIDAHGDPSRERGRHSRGGHAQLAELEKMNLAQAYRWRVYHFTPAQVRDGSAIAFLRAYETRGIVRPAGKAKGPRRSNPSGRLGPAAEILTQEKPHE